MTRALHPSAEALARQIAHAGPEGLVIPLDRYGDAISLSIEGLAHLIPAPLTAMPTDKGKAYAFRSAA